jgi:rod shape-determining protein MreC
MVRRGPPRPVLADWAVLGAAVLVGALFLAGGVALRIDAARLMRSTVFLPFRLVMSYGAHPADLRAELDRTRLALAQRTLDQAQCDEALRENTRLRDLVDFAASESHVLIPAEVVGRAPDRFGETLVLAIPPGATPASGQPVLGIGGLAGCVIDAGGGVCQVRTLRNAALRVSGMLSESRLAGMLRWRAGSGVLALEGVPLQAVACDSEIVITTGYGQIFPKGIPVGAIVTARDDSTGLAREILVRPFVDLDRVEELYLLGD